MEYCFMCSEYPCRKYDGIDLSDSLISHRNQKKDLLKAREIGIDIYLEKQRRKREILKEFLSSFDDGKREVFLCLAVNILPLEELERIRGNVVKEGAESGHENRGEYLERLLGAAAETQNIPLVLRPWRHRAKV